MSGTEKVTSDLGPFSIVPEWLVDSDVSDRAIRLYVVLGRYADDRSHAWPRRKVLAERMGCAPASVDRAMAELRDAGAVEVRARFDGGGQRSNTYVLRRVPESTGDDTPTHQRGGGVPTGDEGPLLTGEEPRNESQSEREPVNEKAPDGATDDDPPTAIVRAAWERLDPKPATPWPGMVKIVRKLLAAGWSAKAIEDAFVEAPTVSTGAVEMVLRKRRGRRPRQERNIDRDRSARSGRVDSL